MNKLSKEIYQYILATVIVIGVFMITYYLLNKVVPEENKDLINIVFGALIGSFVQVVNWFFGSSKGSAEKTEMMHSTSKPKKEETKKEETEKKD